MNKILDRSNAKDRQLKNSKMIISEVPTTFSLKVTFEELAALGWTKLPPL